MSVIPKLEESVFEMDACEIANFLAKELFLYQLAGYENFNSGVGAPTKTTATLTPTTLRNIEQTFFECNNETNKTAIPYQAGFVPPIPPSYQSLTDPDSYHSMDSSVSNSSWQTTSPSLQNDETSLDAINCIQKKTPGRRNRGGRRPNRPTNLTPEEEHKRHVRRERNKLAAARCRRRREDYTNELLKEVDQLEMKKKGLQMEVQDLKREKEDLDILLETHLISCKRPIRPVSPLDLKPFVASALADYVGKIKQEPLDSYEVEEPPNKKVCYPTNNFNSNQIPCTLNNMPEQIVTSNTFNTTLSPMQSSIRPNRPSSLNVPMSLPLPSQNLNTTSSLHIQTPSNGQFNFESLMEGGTGLTPINHPLKAITDSFRTSVDMVSPSCEGGSTRFCSL